MKSETGIRRLAVGLAMSPVHSYTPMARTTFSGFATLCVWAHNGAQASASAANTPPVFRPPRFNLPGPMLLPCLVLLNNYKHRPARRTQPWSSHASQYPPLAASG